MLAGLSAIGAWMIAKWTAFAFAGWALIAATWEPAIRVSLGASSAMDVVSAVVEVGLLWAIAFVLHRQIGREEPQHDTVMW